MGNRKEKKGKNEMKNRTFKLGTLIMALAVSCSMAAGFSAAEAAEAAPASLKPGLYESVAALRTAVDFPLIALDEGCVVQADNVDWQGISARLVTLRFTSGIEITAAAPAEAAPLLKRGGMTLAGNTDLKVVTMDASLAMGPGGACLYFSSGQAAYCLYGPGMTGEQVLHVGLGLTSRNVY